jgi:DNA-binding NarL/FixJ family response regulator
MPTLHDWAIPVLVAGSQPRYPADVSPTIAKTRAAVCLLSSHALFLTQFRSFLSDHGFRPQVSEIDGKFLNGQCDADVLPAASVYVLDVHADPQVMAMVASQILAARPESHMLAVAQRFEEEAAFPLLRAGVQGLISYSDAPEQLHRAVDALASGGYWVPRALLFRFVDAILSKSNGRKALSVTGVRLSQREQQTLHCLLENLSNKEIANQLNISERTVKFHVSNLLAKYGVQRRSDLILLAYQNRPNPQGN